MSNEILDDIDANKTYLTANTKTILYARAILMLLILVSIFNRIYTYYFSGYILPKSNFSLIGGTVINGLLFYYNGRHLISESKQKFTAPKFKKAIVFVFIAVLLVKGMAHLVSLASWNRMSIFEYFFVALSLICVVLIFIKERSYFLELSKQ